MQAQSHLTSTQSPKFSKYGKVNSKLLIQSTLSVGENRLHWVCLNVFAKKKRKRQEMHANREIEKFANRSMSGRAI